MVAWQTACMRTSCGGLGIVDLKLSGFALRVRWLWLLRTEDDRAWSALPIKIELEVQALFDASVTVAVGSGERTLFRLENWINGRSVKRLAPHLFNTISSRVAQKRTVAEALVQRRWIRDIQGRLTILVLRDYVLLWQTPMDVHLSTDMDRFSWRWTATEDYTATSAYKIMHISKTRRSPGLEELGTPAGEVLHLACSQTSAMDNGQTTATWTGCT